MRSDTFSSLSLSLQGCGMILQWAVFFQSHKDSGRLNATDVSITSVAMETNIFSPPPHIPKHL